MTCSSIIYSSRYSCVKVQKLIFQNSSCSGKFTQDFIEQQDFWFAWDWSNNFLWEKKQGKVTNIFTSGKNFPWINFSQTFLTWITLYLNFFRRYYFLLDWYFSFLTSQCFSPVLWLYYTELFYLYSIMNKRNNLLWPE